MMRFFTQMHPKISGKSVNSSSKHPACLTFVKGRLVPSGTPVRNYVDKDDKNHPKRDKESIEEKQPTQMPGFAYPDCTNEEGCFTQKAKKQIEEFKKKKDKPSLHNPEAGE